MDKLRLCKAQGGPYELQRADGQIVAEYECYLRTETEDYIDSLVAQHEADLDKWYAKLCHNRWRRAFAMFSYCCAMNQLECSTPPSEMNPHQLWRKFAAYWHCWAKRWFAIYLEYKERVE